MADEAAVSDFSSLMADAAAEAVVESPEITPDPSAGGDAAPKEGDESYTTPGEGEPAAKEGEAEELDENGEPKVKEDDFDKLDNRKKPDAIRKALKEFRDADPKNKKIAAELNDGYGRYLGYKEVIPTVDEARKLVSTVKAAGGIENVATLQTTVTNLAKTDAILYAGDKRGIDEFYNNSVKAGKPEALGKLAPHVLALTKAKDPAAYDKVVGPAVVQYLRDDKFPDMFNALSKAIQAKNFDAATQLSAEVVRWFTEMDGAHKTTVSEGQQQWEKDKEDFAKNQRVTFNKDVGQAAVDISNKYIINSLRPIVKGNPFFKNFSQPMMQGVVRSVLSELQKTHGKDKVYQGQMDALFNVDSPDRAKLLGYHDESVKNIVDRVTKEVLDRDYPNYAKKGTGQKKTVTATPKPATPGAPKPTVWVTLQAEPKAEDINWDEPGAQQAYTMNRARLKNGKYVKWGKQK